MALDHTHNPASQSWVVSANTERAQFPIQNLPLGVFSISSGDPRCGVAIGDQILDLQSLARSGLLNSPVADAVSGATLDALFALGRPALRALRHKVFAALEAKNPAPDESLLHPIADCTMHLPTSIRSFTDFFVGIHHAIRCAEIAGQAANPLPANYHYMPLGYNGRASTVRVSDEEVHRPLGLRKRIGETEPSFGASRWLDFELEMGFFIGAGNPIGEPITIGDAAEQIVGYCLLNDWSARDIQFFEMAPLGAFNSKSFSTTISPWVVTADALEPFRGPAMERFPNAPPIEPYLDDLIDRSEGGIDVALSSTISTEQMRKAGDPPAPLLETHSRFLYWTCAQMVAQHSITGCCLTVGDLIGTGTISGPTRDGSGSLFELSAGGQTPIPLPNGQSRTFIEDGDEIAFSGRCERPGFKSIGFGTCMGRITPA